MHASSPAVCALKTRSREKQAESFYFVWERKSYKKLRSELVMSRRRWRFLRGHQIHSGYCHSVSTIFQLQINYWGWKSCSFHKAFDIQAWGSKFSHHPHQHAQQAEQGFKPSSGESDRDRGILGVHCSAEPTGELQAKERHWVKGGERCSWGDTPIYSQMCAHACTRTHMHTQIHSMHTYKHERTYVFSLFHYPLL